MFARLDLSFPPLLYLFGFKERKKGLKEKKIQMNQTRWKIPGASSAIFAGLLLACMMASRVSSQPGDGGPPKFPVDLHTHHWVGESTCRGALPVTIKFTPTTLANTYSICKLSIMTNISGVFESEIKVVDVYYQLLEAISISTKLNTTLSDHETEIDVPEAPPQYGTPEELDKLELQFSGSKAERLTANLPVLCGLVILDKMVITAAPAPIRATNSTGKIKQLQSKIEALGIYLPVMITFAVNSILWICCYRFCRKKMFGDDVAIEERLGMVREVNENGVPLNASFEDKELQGRIRRNSMAVNLNQGADHDEEDDEEDDPVDLRAPVDLRRTDSAMLRSL